MPETLMRIEITPGLMRAGWVAFFIIGFFLLVSLLSLLKIMRTLNLQLDFLIYVKSLLQEVRSAMKAGEGGATLEDLGKSREPPTRPTEEPKEGKDQGAGSGA